MRKFVVIFLLLATALAQLKAAPRVYVNKDSYDQNSEIPAYYTADYYDDLARMRGIENLTFDEWFNGAAFFPSWLGLRPALADNGIVPIIGYLGNFAANPVGGRSRSATNTSSVHLGLGLDLEKLTGIKALEHWSIANTWIWRFGNSLTKEYLGNTFNVQQNYGSQTMQLQSIYAIYNNTFAEDWHLTFKIGRFAAGDNFMSKPIYWLYQNNAFDGNPVGVFKQGRLSAYPGGTWAVYAETRYKDGQYLKAGVYQISSEMADSPSKHGLDWSFATADGVNANWELGWDINHDDSGKNPGNVSAGLIARWYNVPYVDGSGRHSPFTYTLYFQADYMLWNLGPVKGDEARYIQRKQDKYRDLRGLIAWAAVQYAPNYAVAEMPIFVNGGLLFNAPFKSRADDVACFGIAYGKFSDRLSSYEANSYEIAMEFNYKFQINRFMFVQPNVQVILNTGGGRYSDAMVLGMQYGMAF